MRLRPVFGAITLAAVMAGWIAAPAQSPPASSVVSPPPAVSMDPGQITPMLQHLAQRAKTLEPMLGELRTADWVAKGAPSTYTDQVQSMQNQNVAIAGEMTALADHPDHLEDGMKALYRLEHFNRTVDAMLGSIRRYQDPDIADRIEATAAAGQNDLDRLQQYLLDLAAEKEYQLGVMDREAQRCRAGLAGPSQRPGTRPSAQKTNR